MSAPAPAANSTAPPPSTTVSPPPPPSANATTPAPSTTPSPPPPVSSPSPPATPAPSTSPPPPTAPEPSSSPPPPPATVKSPPPPPSSPSTTPSPPPPPPKTPSTTKSPPPPPSPPPPSSSSGSSPTSSSGISTGVVVGIAIGGVVILAVLCLFFIFCRKKKRRRRYDDEGAFYGRPPVPPPPGPKVDPYGDRQQHWQQNHPPPPNHVVTAMPKPPPPPPVASRPPYPAERISAPPPPLPPAFISSSGGSGSNYSGSDNPLPPPSPGIGLSFSRSTFTYEELARATEGFSDANLLGQGGFGFVHKGVLPNGKEVAVKQLKAGSGQGEREFQAEVEIISRVHHKHLVSLVGYCITGAQRLLVYEFVPNNTLEFHLHGSGRPTMEWPTRLKIALGSAKGLAYLHEDCHPKIIHRDIKASNILLDYKFEAMVADFGLAKFTDDINTHVSTRVMGTFGYMAPEYASSGKLTEKSDVFSFGIMLLELITGKRPVDPTPSFMEDSFVDWARPKLLKALADGKFDELADPKLENGYDHNEMAHMIACAAACVRHSAKNRPRMSQVVRALEGDMSLSDFNEEIRPGNRRAHGSYGSSDYDTIQYNKDMIEFRKMALGSEEYVASGEYSEPSSQHGLHPSGSSSEGQNTREMEMGKFKGNSQGFSGSSQ